MQPPVNGAFTIGRGNQGVHAMNQAVLRAKVANGFKGPWPPRLPCQTERLRPDVLKEARKILDIRAARPERRRALEKHDTCPNGLGNLKRLHPRLPDFVRILKRPEEGASVGIDRPPQTAVGRTRWRVRDQLPCLETKFEFRRSNCTPASGNLRGGRIVESRLDFDHGKLGK